MSNYSFQDFTNSAYELVTEHIPEKYIPKKSTVTNVLGGAAIGVLGQPASNAKKAFQHAAKGTTRRTIFNNIMAPRRLADGSIIPYSGGWRNLFTALPFGILGSTVKQGTKGTALVYIDNQDLPLFIKVIFSSVIITTVITPFDRFSNALVSYQNKHLSKIDIIKTVLAGGVPSLYKGATANISKDFTEALLIYTMRHFKALYVKSIERELTTQEGALMALFTTILKLVITQPLDGIKAYQQQGLTPGIRTPILEVVRQQGLYKLFTAGLLFRFFLNYLSIMVSFIGLHFNDLLKEQKRLDKENEVQGK